MDYKKKYKEALERARALRNEAIEKEYAVDYIKDYETIFPELRESEDERIRKLLVWQVYRNIEDETNDLAQSVYDGIKGHDPDLEESIEDWKKCLAWLEKQKEQKPELLKPHKGDDCNPYDMGVSEAQEYAINRGFGIPFNNGEVYVNERYLTQTIGNILRWADEHPKEQKSIEWSEEDQVTLDVVCDVMDVDYEEDDKVFGACGHKYDITWGELKERLKSLRPQPSSQPNTNHTIWHNASEEKPTKLPIIHIWYHGKRVNAVVAHENIGLQAGLDDINFQPDDKWAYVEDLLNAQPHWKPSEGQRERLHPVLSVLSHDRIKKAIEIYPDECDCKVNDVVKVIIKKA